MASSGKFDLSSGSPDRPLYNTGPRGSYTAASLDVTSFLQCLRFDLKSMAVDHKFNRHGEFKRLASAALGASDGSPSGLLKTKLPSSTPEDLKRLRAGLRESTSKARERVKIFSESLSVINKCFPSIPLRKRSRPDALPGVDRPNGLLVNRAVAGAGTGKTGSQGHVLSNASDFEHQKVEDRGKNAIPNKRTRTSMVDQRADVRPNTPARSSGNAARDKEVLRPPNSNAFQNEDRTLPIVADGWEKAKMKKKRTGIKVDVTPSPSSASTKPVDGYREPKQGIHPYGFRPGAANAVAGVGKSDGASQQAGIGVRSSIPRPEQENTSPLHDKRDRANCSEKERTNLRAVNKANVREEFISGSPTSSTKPQAVARGPRSGSGVVPKSSPVVRRAAASGDWELSHGANKLGPTNRKRTLSTRSSSPPVAQWADRRPQKMSRTARRTNLVPIVSSNDEATALDTSDASENGPRPVKRFPAGSPQHFKTKNKLVKDEDRVDGVRRQGRTGRGFASSRSAAPTAVRNVGTAKQLRTARLGFEKSESKPGRPPTRKLSDRKAYTRQKNTAINAATDFHVGLDDGHNELSAAVKAVINPDPALSSPFWRQMEPLFGFVSDMDMCYLKQQVTARLFLDLYVKARFRLTRCWAICSVCCVSFGCSV